MQTFKINSHLSAECETYQTRYSWGHKAWLYRDGQEISYTKITYYNRTWESYEFESILRKLAGSVSTYATPRGITPREYGLFCKKIETNWKEEDKARVDKEFGTIASIAKLGELFAPDQKSQNDWKKRMLTAGLENKGLIIPEDWEALSEDDKQARLDGVIATLKA